MKSDCFMKAVLAACAAMPAYRDELCKLDSYIGDADHGVTIERGFKSVAGAGLEAEQDCGGFFTGLSQTLIANMGGAIGPIYGMYFNSLAAALKNAEEITAENLSAAMTAGIAMIRTIAKAKPGEKTVLDAMIPLCEELKNCAELPLAQALRRAADAGKAGAQATRDMIATKGRARFLKEKSLGYEDPGAVSFAIFMDEITKNLEGEIDG